MGDTVSGAQIDELAWHLRGGATTVLTGAGVSTDSGIPDYRGPAGSLKKRSPVTIAEFLRSAENRQRYWARSCRGWSFMESREPNEAHRILARMQSAGTIGTIITQNVDGLHQAAGTRDVLELHGGLARVLCLECGHREDRGAVQARMLRMNPGWLDHSAEIAPDGDSELPPELTRQFRVPPCPVCGGTLKPDVVFFGESVPRERVQAAFAAVNRGDRLLVLGSSLTVYSGYRFADHATRTGRPLLVVNRGPTRADAQVAVRIDGLVADVLSRLAARMTPSGSTTV